MGHLSSRILKYIGYGLMCMLSAFASALPENHAINGGLTIIPIDIKQKPEVFFNQHRIAVIESPNSNQWLLIVGMPLANKTPIHQLNMTKPYPANIPFHVSHKSYKTQYLTIENKRKVDPMAKDKQRIRNESKKLTSILAHYSPKNPFVENFKPPVQGPISSLFGLQRVYNKKPRAPHSGLDIAAPEGSPVRVISQGKVVDAHDYFFTGNTVVVDHGMGVFSLYAHLKQINVKIGDVLKQSDPVGTVGMTGRVTGPHLHWSMIMNQTYVDPLLFVPKQKITTLTKRPKNYHKTDMSHHRMLG